MIPIQMELGGKDVCLVLEDADLELAATHIIKGGFSYRWCMAPCQVIYCINKTSTSSSHACVSPLLQWTEVHCSEVHLRDGESG
jgi:hypothetical protein